MTIFVCGPDDVLSGCCPECGGWLHRVRRGGFADPGGMNVCDEDCLASAQEHRSRQSPTEHVRLRDLMCTCLTCTLAGHPTPEERAEYEAWQRAETGP